MINEMSTHASIYTPLSIPPTQLPRYILFDRNSQWHSSALLSVALESITLPARLRQGVQKRWHINDLEAALNVNGNQRIAQLQCSMIDPEEAPPETTITHESTDARTPSANNRILFERDGVRLAESSLDIDFTCGNTRSMSQTATQYVSDRVFSVMETVRTKVETAEYQETDEDEISYTRKRRQLAGLPVIERFVAATLSSVLSFWRILSYATKSRVDITPRLSIHCSIASREFSPSRRSTLTLRFTPRFRPHQESVSESKLYNVWSTR